MSHGRNASRFAAPSLIPRGAFLAHLGAACFWRGRSLRPSGLEPATGAAVAALIPANKRVILNRRWYKALRVAFDGLQRDANQGDVSDGGLGLEFSTFSWPDADMGRFHLKNDVGWCQTCHL